MKASINGELTFLKIVNLEIDRVFRLKQLNKFIQSGQIGCTINYIGNYYIGLAIIGNIVDGFQDIFPAKLLTADSAHPNCLCRSKAFQRYTQDI